MKVIYGLRGIKGFRHAVVALGIFDGIHLGHCRILKEAVKKAKAIKGKTIVITFWPHPQRERSIYSLEHRLRLLRQMGIDICIVIKFTQVFKRISPENFIKDILIKKISPEYLYVGENFHFGRAAKGDCRLLRKLSRKYNFKIKTFKLLKINQRPISSSYIRLLITQGNLRLAARLLLRPVSILGTVIKGYSWGRSLGFPTANINPHHEVLPPEGIYAVRVIFNKRRLKGVCYIGGRPTFRRKGKKTIEVYIFNFNQNIYGKYLEIQFIKKIRDEKKFPALNTLVEQIKNDIKTAQEILARH
ncbi:MAG: bifunctional riboflavin kinase/FAD synthetase [Candidatus Omnitrophica bacterium]|nr:bifunctional riboflavin kinase/FAD synthetase [Candidatus Omnitrophota bacterium]